MILIRSIQSYMFCGAALFLSATLSTFGNISLASDLVQPALVDVAPDHAFAPLGFDDNDNSQIVIEGDLPDTCYKLGPTQTRFDHGQHKIFIKQQAYFYPSAWCLDVGVPYTQTVNLGILSSGKYEVVIEGSDNSLAQLPVETSTTSKPDNFLYAPVNDIQIEKTEAGTAIAFNLQGTFPNECMQIKTVMTMIRPNHVIEVLPILELPTKTCESRNTKPFSVKVPIAPQSEAGRYLIHIRSLNGQSINKIVEF